MAFCSFGELLICHRLLYKNEKTKSVIQELIESVTNINQGEKCIDILTNDKFSSSLVDKIGNLIPLNEISILLNKVIEICPHEYESLLSFQKKENNDESKKYECLFWDNSDLISSVFEYLDLKSLNNCSKVNFLWCIHSFSINSIYDIDLEILFNLNDFNEKRIWQRFCNVRSVHYFYYDTKVRKVHEITQTFIDNYSSLKHIEKLRIVFGEYIGEMELLLLKAVGKTSNKLKELHLTSSNINYDNYNTLAAIDLTRCSNVVLKGMACPIFVSNACHRLVLKDIPKISYQWCQNLLNKGELDGIRKLEIDNIAFEKKIKNDKKVDDYVINLGKSFVNINYLEISIANLIHDSMYTFWSNIQSNINKNNGIVKLVMSYRVDIAATRKLIQFLCKYIDNDMKSIKITRLSIDQTTNIDNVLVQLKQLLLLKQIEPHIEFLNIHVEQDDGFKHLIDWWEQLNDKMEKNADYVYKFGSLQCVMISPFNELKSLAPIIDYLQARLRWNQLHMHNINDIYCNYERMKFRYQQSLVNKQFLNDFNKLLTLLTQFIQLKIPIWFQLRFRMQFSHNLNFDDDHNDDDNDNDDDDEDDHVEAVTVPHKKRFKNFHDKVFLRAMSRFIQNKSDDEYIPRENQYCCLLDKGPASKFQVQFVWKQKRARLTVHTAKWRDDSLV